MQQLTLFDTTVSSPAHPSADTGAPGPARAAGPGDPADVPIAFRHPNADREIQLQEHVVGYSLRRARRRSIGFIVGVEGLSVNAPKWVGQSDIESALREKSNWILRKLQEQQERTRRLQAAKVEWHDGACIPFLGSSVRLVLDPRATGAVLQTPWLSPMQDQPLHLVVGLATSAPAPHIREAVHDWLQRQARRLFEERCSVFAQQLGVRVTKLSLSSAQTRWGSASADGSIRLNWRLVHFALPSIDYVVVHELAHLREMNHSARFWDVVRSVLPDYQAARSSLKDGLVPLLD